MFAPIARSALLRRSGTAAAATTSSMAIASASTQSRTMLTKAEKWSHDDIANALDSPESKISLSHVAPQIEARWASMSKVEQYSVYRQLEELQRKDWTELTLDEKKAIYYVSFGPYGPRKPIVQEGQATRTFVGVTAAIGATAVIFFGLRHFAAPPPKTMTKEYQEQMTERAKEKKLNPISGISSEGYKGKGFVQSD